MRTIPIDEITVTPNRQRRTFDPATLNELSESIRENGLFNAVVLRKEGDTYVLVSGERRLRAVRDMRDLGIRFSHDGEEVPEGHIPYTFITALDPLSRELAELDENLRRDDLTWQERATALARVAELRTAAARAEGLPPPSTAVLAEEFHTPVRDGFTGTVAHGRETVRQQLAVAKLLHDPDVASAKTVGEAYKIAKRKESRARDAAHAEKVGSTFTASMHTVVHADSLEWLGQCPSERFDVILTDPIYGMGADEFGDSGGKVAGEHGYKDDNETFMTLVDVCHTELFRVAKPQAHLYWFCDIDKFHYIQDRLKLAGWWVHRTPIIWHKPSAARVPWPEHGPQRKYELVLYAVKGKRPTLKISPDLVSYNPDANLGHSAQKPVALYRDLLSRSARPGDAVLDPFCGTGPIFPAAHELKVAATGVELDQAYYGISLKRIGGLK